MMTSKHYDWHEDRPRPLDLQFNAAVMHIANVLNPTGFDVSATAPSTYQELIAYINLHKRLVVFSGGSEQTIYADREVNYCFRAWHDWCHAKGAHDFSLEGEKAVWAMQCEHIVKLYGDGARTRTWHVILWAEIVGQWLFREAHGDFPADQVAFVNAVLGAYDRVHGIKTGSLG